MTIIQKFGFSFVIALSFHLALLALFGVNFSSDDVERVKKKPLPEIIKASILDDNKIMEEANRLKTVEENKKLTQVKQQQALDNKRADEQKQLQDVKEKRLQAEKAVKEVEAKRKQLDLKEKQRRANIEKLKAEEVARQEKVKTLKAAEAARLAKIKEQKIAEKKHQEELRKAKEEKSKQERLAKEKIEQDKIAKQKVATEKKSAALRKQAADAQAKEASNRQIRISAEQAIDRKVNSKWIRPLSSTRGLTALIRVKLLSSGDVMDVAVIKSSGDTIFDRSAENAVRKASPLPVPKDRTLFMRDFRSFTFTFNPE